MQARKQDTTFIKPRREEEQSGRDKHEKTRDDTR
jgi:hypothetical protein